jgi:hypothetical protein
MRIPSPPTTINRDVELDNWLMYLKDILEVSLSESRADLQRYYFMLSGD